MRKAFGKNHQRTACKFVWIQCC